MKIVIRRKIPNIFKGRNKLLRKFESYNIIPNYNRYKFDKVCKLLVELMFKANIKDHEIYIFDTRFDRDMNPCYEIAQYKPNYLKCILSKYFIKNYLCKLFYTMNLTFIEKSDTVTVISNIISTTIEEQFIQKRYVCDLCNKKYEKNEPVIKLNMYRLFKPRVDYTGIDYSKKYNKDIYVCNNCNNLARKNIHITADKILSQWNKNTSGLYYYKQVLQDKYDALKNKLERELTKKTNKLYTRLHKNLITDNQTIKINRGSTKK